MNKKYLIFHSNLTLNSLHQIEVVSKLAYCIKDTLSANFANLSPRVKQLSGKECRGNVADFIQEFPLRISTRHLKGAQREISNVPPSARRRILLFAADK
jgi:uncharacterized protein YjiK